MCIDFTDLNKACPKDSYPLPRIDQLVDATAGYELLSLDAFSGYNQIKMYSADEEKTSFITDYGTYCYTVMPFGLKTAEATFQRGADMIFEPPLGRTVEVYVDDILVKSKRREDHVSDLKAAFDLMRQHNMRLNPEKCAFGVASGKFLGYMVTPREIEANPDKVAVIMEMEAPKNVTEIQRLAGRITALGRFIVRSGDRCGTFFKVLQGLKKEKGARPWNSECQQAFEELKQSLTKPPLLSSPTPGENLFLYLAVSTTAISSVLFREERDMQKPVYYVSKVLKDTETRYTAAEKLAYALLITVRRLRPYFQAHPIHVLTDQPVKQILAKPGSSGRLEK
jgi:hypothetical protein